MKKFKNNILVVVIIVLVVFSVLYYYPSNYSFNKTQKSKTNTNSAFVILTRNDDLRGILSSIRQLEDRFNSRVNGGYDYVFLNDDKFDQNFIKRTSSIISTKAAYGQIPKEDWEAPKWIDEKRAQETRIQMKETNVPYGDSVSYRNMCRFNSGKFYNHPLLKSYDYYWRVEPDVSFYCDMDQDPFLGLQLYNASYGFVISIKEYPETIPTLWDAVKEFMTLYPQHIAPDNSLEFISSDGGATYNGCHFWSNFEIGDLNFFRSQAYTDFFNFLDAKGGFYYERWGDAPVHSIAAALLLSKHQILHMNEIGYYHIPYLHCPLGFKEYSRCHCDQFKNDDLHPHSCYVRWDKFVKGRRWEL